MGVVEAVVFDDGVLAVVARLIESAEVGGLQAVMIDGVVGDLCMGAGEEKAAAAGVIDGVVGDGIAISADADAGGIDAGVVDVVNDVVDDRSADPAM